MSKKTTMNNAEDIFEQMCKKRDARHLVYKSDVIEAMQAHTNQTLQYLKEKVKIRKMNIDPDDNRVMAGRNYELEWIITLIDKSINE